MGFNPTQEEIDKTAADYLQGLNAEPPAPDTTKIAGDYLKESGMDPDMQYLADLDKNLAEQRPDLPPPSESPLAVTDKTGPKVSEAVDEPEPEAPPPDPNDPHTQYMQSPEPEPEPADEEDKQFDSTINELAADKPAQAPTPAPKGIQARELASTKGDESKLVSKAPAWYEAFEPPPKHTGGPQAAGALFGGLLKSIGSFAAADSAKGNRAKEQAIGKGFGDLMSGMGGAAEAKINAPEQDYKNRLDAAGKQAQMVATLRSGQGNGNALGAANLDLQERKFARLLQQDATKAATKAALDNVNSPESKALRESYVASGIFKPEVAAKLSGSQMLAGRVGAQGQAGFDRNTGEHTRMYNMRMQGWVEKYQMANNEHDRRVALDEINKIAAEDRSEGRLNDQAEIPGWKFAGKGRPNAAAVETARKIADATERIQSDAEALNELKKQVSTRAKVTPGWLQGTLSEEDRALIDEMHSAVFDLRRANAQLGEMGAPQAFEETMLESLTPDAAGLQSFLNNGTAWAAQGRTAHRLAKARMKSYKFVPDDDSYDAPAAAPPHGQGKTLTGKIKEVGQAMRPVVKDAVGAGKQIVSGAVDTAKDVVSGVGQKDDQDLDQPIGEFWVTMPTVEGQPPHKIRRPMTQRQYDNADKLGYPLEPVQ